MSGTGDRWREWAGDWAGNRTGSWAGTRPSSGVRVGDAEREAAVSALGEHYAAGRLTKEEFDERSELAWSARTGADLAPLFSDLPRAAARPPQQAPAKPDPRGRAWRVPFLPLLLVLVGVVALTHVAWPIFLVIGVLWWAGLFRWGRRRTCQRGPGWR